MNIQPEPQDRHMGRRLAEARVWWRLLRVYISPRALWAARTWFQVRARLAPVDLWRLRGRSLAQRLMQQHNTSTTDLASEAASTRAQNGAQPETQKPAPRVQRFLLVRHGQSTFNVEGRLPSQLPNVPLTDEGRRQARQAAGALAGLNLSAVVSSPLERARETAEIIARVWALPVREDPRLMDTEMGKWAGRKISEVSKDDPNWLKFVEKPTEPPEGIEGFEQVRQRAVAVIEALRADPTAGNDVVVVAHADVIKLVIANYTGVPLDGARYIVVGNASISALAFTDEHAPTLLAVNWTTAPLWLEAPRPAASTQGSAQANGLPQRDERLVSEEPETGAPSGVIM